MAAALALAETEVAALLAADEGKRALSAAAAYVLSTQATLAELRARAEAHATQDVVHGMYVGARRGREEGTAAAPGPDSRAGWMWGGRPGPARPCPPLFLLFF